MTTPIIPTRPGGSDAAPQPTAAAEPARPQPLEGKTEVDDKLSFECEALAWAAVGRIADRIANDLWALEDVAKAGLTAFLVDEASSRAFHLCQATALQVETLKTAFDRARDRAALPPEALAAASPPEPELAAPKIAVGVMGGLAAVTAGAAAAIDLLALFRSDTAYKGRPVSVPQRALLLELGRRLRDHKPKEARLRLFCPRLQLVPPAKGRETSQSRLVALFQPAEAARANAEAAIVNLSRAVARKEQEIAEGLKRRRGPSGDPPKGDPPPPAVDAALERQIAALAEDRARLESARRLLESTEAQSVAMMAALHARDEASGATVLALVQQALEIGAHFEKPDGKAFLVFAEAVAAGGSYRVTKTLWRTFFAGDGLEFSGGAIVAYAVIDGDAELVLCGTHRAYRPHRGFSRPDEPYPDEELDTVGTHLPQRTEEKAISEASGAQKGEAAVPAVSGKPDKAAADAGERR
jgi:hypothetical protein